MKKIVIAVIVVVVIGIAGFLLLTIKGGGPKYATEKVTRGDIEATVTATGTLNAVTNVMVGSQVSGTIQQLYVDFNSPVKKGQIIAQIDPALFNAQVQQAQANVDNAKANLVKAQASQVDTKRTLGRYAELFKRNLVARSDLDTADTNNATNVASVSAAKTLVDQTTAALSLAQINLHYTKILSPVDGVVISRNVDVGQTVAASFQTPTLFNLAVDLTKMQIDTSVDESDVSNVKVGQAVEFSVDAYPATTYKGTVLQVRNAATTVQNVVTYDVIVQVDNRDMTLMPGMTAQVSIITSLTKNVLRIPDAALRFKPVETGGTTVKKPGAAPKGLGPAVWILEDNKPKRIPLSVGFSDGTFTQIISGALTEGQDVITESLAKPKAQAASGSGPRMF